MYDKDDHETLDKLEKVLESIMEENEYAEDMVNQIIFLEHIDCEISSMYSKHRGNFKCEFIEERDKVIEVLEKFISSLTEDLGSILESLFRKRNRTRETLKENKEFENGNINK